MSEIGDIFGAQREQRQREGFNNRLRAESDFPEARRRLRAAELFLVRYSAMHYALRGHGEKSSWLLNIYPGNRRILKGVGSPPYLKLPAEWTLLDVADAAIKLKEKRSERERAAASETTH